MTILKRIILSLFSSIALTTSFNNIYNGGIKQLHDIVLIPLIPMWFLFLVGIIFSVLLFFYYKNNTLKDNMHINLLAGLFTLFMIIGNSYELYGSIFKLFTSYHIILTFINIIGYYAFFINTLIKIKNKMQKEYKQNDLPNYKIVKWFKQKPLLFCLLTLGLAWSIYYIAFYPMVLSPDPSYQIKQFLGEHTKYMDYSILIDENVTITNHHPVFHTFLLGSCLKLGRSLINDNFGLFIYAFLQGLALALTLSRIICFLKNKGVKNKYLLLMLLGYAIVPIFPLYAINGNKDVFYTICFINLSICLFNYIDKYKKVKCSWFKVLELAIFSLLLCLFRNNGVIIVLVIFLTLLFYSKINIYKILIMFLSCLTIYFSFENILLPKLGITGTSIRESMSLFLQQTAREIVCYEEDISPKDKQAISQIIDYDKVKKNYNPVFADPVKNTFNKYATSLDLKNYFLAWGKGLVRHPLVYLDATLNNTYGYFDPEDISWYIYVNYDSRVTQNNLVDYHYNRFNNLRNILKVYGALFAYIPLIGLLCNIGFSTWLVIVFAWYLFVHNKKYLLFLLPFVVSILICFASPVNTYFRYAMPVIFSEYLLIGTWIIIATKKN